MAFPSDSNQAPLSDFYESLFTSLPTGTNDVLVARMETDDGSPHSFQVFSIYGVDDIDYLISEITEGPYLVHIGSFLPFVRKNGSVYYSNNKARLQSVHGFCVDIDAPHGSDFVDLEAVLSKIDCISVSDLKPDYLSLSGHGVHLWYTLDSPVQSFGPRSNRRQRLSYLIKALYDFWNLSIDSFIGSIDYRCANAMRGFRAPGTQTKQGQLVPCFKFLKKHEPTKADKLARSLWESGIYGDVSELYLLDSNDLEWRFYDKLSSPSITERQRNLLISLHERGFVIEDDFKKFQKDEMDGVEAWDVVHEALRFANKEEGWKDLEGTIDRSSWKTQPHPLISGSTGGVYRVVLDNITKSLPGNRYNSLKMLAGVAFMMDKPPVTKEQLSLDMRALIRTDWAKRKSSDGRALDLSDVEKALRCYCADNRQTRNSIVSALGFDPFNAPAKRNYRSQKEHLALVASKKNSQSLEKIISVLNDNPTLTKKQAASACGLSYSTVRSHWDSACTLLGINPTRKPTGRPKIQPLT